jgi:hypothetical protein
MSLIGPFYNAVNEDENIYDFVNFTIPGQFELGVIPAEYVFEELKAIVTSPAAAGTTFTVINQDGDIIVPAGRLTVDRASSSTANINRRITAQTKLIGVFEGNSVSACSVILIKKILRIP